MPGLTRQVPQRVIYTGHLTSWTTEGAALNFRWREQDGPVLAPPIREGLGSTLIRNSLPGATVTHDLKADGLECEISLPLAPLSMPTRA